jgi:hypothetical protein
VGCPGFLFLDGRSAGAISGATSREPIQGPDGLSQPLVREMGVPLRHPGIGVTEENLCGPQVSKAHLDVARKRMPEVVEAEFVILASRRAVAHGSVLGLSVSGLPRVSGSLRSPERTPPAPHPGALLLVLSRGANSSRLDHRYVRQRPDQRTYGITTAGGFSPVAFSGSRPL